MRCFHLLLIANVGLQTALSFTTISILSQRQKQSKHCRSIICHNENKNDSSISISTDKGSKRYRLYRSFKRVKGFFSGYNEDGAEISRELNLADGRRIRGEGYYSNNTESTTVIDIGLNTTSNSTSTIPSPTEVALALNVKPAQPDASVALWKRAYRTHRKVLPCE